MAKWWRAREPVREPVEVAVDRLRSLAARRPAAAQAVFALIDSLAAEAGPEIAPYEPPPPTDADRERYRRESFEKDHAENELAREYMVAWEVARAMGIPEPELRRRVKADDTGLPVQFAQGRRMLFPREAFAKWAAASGARFRPDPDVLHAQQAAELLGVDAETLHRLHYEGHITTIGGNTRRYFSRRHLEQWIAEGRPPKPPPSLEELIAQDERNAEARARVRAFLRRGDGAARGSVARKPDPPRGPRGRWKFQRDKERGQ